jgi:hypothetical protein
VYVPEASLASALSISNVVCVLEFRKIVPALPAHADPEAVPPAALHVTAAGIIADIT